MSDPKTVTPEAIDKELQKTIDGLKKADTDVDNFPQWDFQKQGPLSGTVVKIKGTVQTRRGEEIDVYLAVVDVGGEFFILWESANLKEFFKEIGAGSTIVVVPRGDVALPGAKRMNLFDAYHS